MLPYLALTTAMLLWASSFIALKYVFPVFDPIVVLFARMVIASLCIALLVLRPGEKWRYEKGDWKWLLAMGIAEPCLYFMLEARALLYTSASQAGVITATLPLLAALVAWAYLKEKPTRMTWLGMAVSFSGVVMLTMAGETSDSAPNPLLGNFLEFLAMVCASGYMMTIKRLSPRYSPLVLTGVQTLMGMLWFGGALLTPWVTLPTEFPFWPVMWVVYLGAVITLGAYGLNTWAISRVRVAIAAAFVNLIPVFTVLLAWFILGETLTWVQGLACLLVFGGVMLSQRQSAGAPVPVASQQTAA